MQQFVNAIYENGVFKPMSHLTIKNGQQVRLIVDVPSPVDKREIIQRMRELRDKMEPLDGSIKDLVEEGREH
jgi:predicted DNA-binding antitoxin AbrB/MazE fold protein